MSEVEDFLTAEQEQAIISAIRVAEKNSSGEIRVHIENNNDKPAMYRALEVFHLLKMNHTKLRNGVLFYIAVESKTFAIIGDEGIDQKVPDNFWDSEKALVLNHFKKGEFSKGLGLAILKAGEKLKEFFPFESDDTNELTDEISKG